MTKATLNCKGKHDLFIVLVVNKANVQLYEKFVFSFLFKPTKDCDTHCAMILGYHSSAISWTLPKQYCFPSDSVVRSMFLNPNSVQKSH